MGICDHSYFDFSKSSLYLCIMLNSKIISLFFLLLFCSKFAVANQSVGTLFLGEDFILVKTICQNKESDFPESETSDENPLGPITSCTSSSVFVVFFSEVSKSTLEGIQILDRQNYFYKDKLKMPVDLERPLPPPKLA